MTPRVSDTPAPRPVPATPPTGADPATARLRPVRAHGPAGSPGTPRAWDQRPSWAVGPAWETPAPAPRSRRPVRAAGALVCAVLGLGLIGGAVTGGWLTGDSRADSAARTPYTEAGTLWHSVPVDVLFPRSLRGEDTGPGGADRVWTRVAVAPDSTCAAALEPGLVTTLAPVGCTRVVRATYTDATASHVTTVGLVFTAADAVDTVALNTRFTTKGLAERPALMPRAFAAPDTVAARFGDRQRASWMVKVLTDAPVVVFAVSGFADGRPVERPEPAVAARAKGATSAPAQAGLGHEAAGVAGSVERALRDAFAKATEPAP
ncbi:hypothetical protein ACFVIM_22700 [Streptomyces sp. NPDC057638]|uniref:hypothetical protein n=1 Tax=Streptomyces sp. NPDC057638 TaxID=3346190 RepID=UPI00367AAECF